jgi:hypothetical protein
MAGPIKAGVHIDSRPAVPAGLQTSVGQGGPERSRRDDPPVNRRAPASATLLVIVAVCSVQVVVAVWRTRHAWFVTDDFLNFIMYREMGLSFAYLFTEVFGHITPLYRLVQAISFDAFGLSFAPVRATIIAMAVIPTFLLILIANRLKVPLALSFAAASLLVLPGLAATFLCLWLLVGRSGAGPSDNEAALAGFAFATGTGFYDKTLFASVVFFGLLVSLYAREQSLLTSAWRALLGLRWVIVVAVLWLTFLLAVRGPSPPAPSPGVAIHFAWLAWGDATVGALFGLGSPGRIAGSAAVSLALAEIILLVIAAATIVRTGRRGAIIWAAVATYSLVTIMLTARMRAHEFGAAFGRSLRYEAEPASFIILAALVATGAGGIRHQRTAIIAGLALATNVILNATIPPIGDAPDTRRYVETLGQSLRQVDGEPTIVIAESAVPAVVMPPWMAPFNVQSKFVPLITRQRILFADQSRASWLIDQEGKIEKIK